MLSIGPPGDQDHSARDAGALASCRILSLLALEISELGRPAKDCRSALLTQDRVLHNLAIGRGFQSFVHTSESGLRAPNEIIFDLQRPFGLQPFITRHV